MTVPNAKWQPGTGKQVILKSDFVDIENAILTQGTVRMQPPLVWVDNTRVKILATADCIAPMQFTGMPNILNPAIQVNGGLSDGKVRSVNADTSMIITTGGLYGTTQAEMASQWYAVFGIAAEEDTDFILQCLPLMRANSHNFKVVGCGELIYPANNRNYGFTADDSKIVGGKLYFLTGASKGLMRPIIHNNVASGATTIEYSGDDLSLNYGDWFIILPPTNFRLVGFIFNNASSHIDVFFQDGSQVAWAAQRTMAAPSGAPSGTPTEDITCAPPTAIALGVQGRVGTYFSHPEGTSPIYTGAMTYAPALTYYQRVQTIFIDPSTYFLWSHDDSGVHDQTITPNPTYEYTFAEVPIKNCKYRGGTAGGSVYCIYYKHPPGCGF